MEARTRRRLAFTLVELLAVMAIIGILLAFILVASSGAVREAQDQSTRSLITKLDGAMADLVEQILTTRNDPTYFDYVWAHLYMANVSAFTPNDRATAARAEVFANYGKMRAELPDVFFVQDTSLGNQSYPLNFALAPVASTPGGLYDYVLPLGLNSIPQANMPPQYPVLPSTGSGIFGASYAAAAGLYKNLGNVPSSVVPNAQAYMAPGLNGVDDDGDGLVDNLNEGVQGNAAIANSVAASLKNHKHKTARAEMLYALLVEGRGPYGAVISRDEFTDKEVGDTDQDGLPEFLDAWGEPLYFFRWPIFYHSDLQRGLAYVNGSPQPPYVSTIEPREQDPLDPNQQLLSPTWWLSIYNQFGPPVPPYQPAAGPMSAGAITFQSYFHQLIEPLSYASPSPFFSWDRSSGPLSPRRAFYSRFLIISSGPDKALGLPILPDTSLKPLVTLGIPTACWALQRESEAGPYDILGRLASIDPVNAGFSSGNPPNPVDAQNTLDPKNPATFPDEGLDDISNHNLQTAGGSR